MATEATNLSVNQDHHLDEIDENLDFGKFTKNFNNDKVAEFFELSKTIKWINEKKYTRVALQFPHCFIDHSSFLARNIESQTSAKVVILTDTPDGNRVIDGIAPANANCDALVHYDDCRNFCLSALPEKNSIDFYEIWWLDKEVSTNGETEWIHKGNRK